MGPTIALEMLPVQRSPPDRNQSSAPIIHYDSDSALNTSSKADHHNAFLNFAKRQKHKLDDYTEITEIKNMFGEMKSQQDHKFDGLSNAMNIIIAQNQEIMQSVQQMNFQYEEITSRMLTLETQNEEYKGRIAALEAQVDYLENQTRSTTIEIRNVPIQDKEDNQKMVSVVKDIGSALHVEPPIQKSDIRNIYRTKSSAIVVEFSSTATKASIITGVKKRFKSRIVQQQKPLNTSEINLPGTPQPIFISESLTMKARHLFYIARENVKNKRLFAAWTSYGKIYVKTEEGKVPVRIISKEDLDRVTSL